MTDRLILLACLLLISFSAFAGRPVTFGEVCPGYTISKRGHDLLIRCPGEPRELPWMTIQDCKEPVAKRSGDRLTITCKWQRKK